MGTPPPPPAGWGVSDTLPNGLHPSIPILGYNYWLRLICWPHAWICDIRQGRCLPASCPTESQHQPLQAVAGKLNPDTVSWGPILTLHFRGTNAHLNSPLDHTFLKCGIRIHGGLRPFVGIHKILPFQPLVLGYLCSLPSTKKTRVNRCIWSKSKGPDPRHQRDLHKLKTKSLLSQTFSF